MEFYISHNLSFEITAILRIILAGTLGALVGMERQAHGRVAGMRTYSLVGMAGALVMSLALHIMDMTMAPSMDTTVRLSPTRLPSYAIAGMGFLGAGAIVQGKRTVRGVTTAAAMWLCTIMGLCVGAGLYLPAAATALLTLFTLKVVKTFASKVTSPDRVKLVVETDGDECLEAVRKLLIANNAQVIFAGRR